MSYISLADAKSWIAAILNGIIRAKTEKFTAKNMMAGF
jgi:hypothetical protein